MAVHKVFIQLGAFHQSHSLFSSLEGIFSFKILLLIRLKSKAQTLGNNSINNSENSFE